MLECRDNHICSNRSADLYAYTLSYSTYDPTSNIDSSNNVASYVVGSNKSNATPNSFAYFVADVPRAPFSVKPVDVRAK